jgi:hypothetical protein
MFLNSKRKKCIKSKVVVSLLGSSGSLKIKWVPGNQVGLEKSVHFEVDPYFSKNIETDLYINKKFNWIEEQ